MVTPVEFLRGKADETAMFGNSRQRPAKAKTVGQENIRTFCPELFSVIFLSKQDVTNGRLNRGYQHIRCFPTTATDMPAT